MALIRMLIGLFVAALGAFMYCDLPAKNTVNLEKYNSSKYFDVLIEVVHPSEVEEAGNEVMAACEKLLKCLHEYEGSKCLDIPLLIAMVEELKEKHAVTMKKLIDALREQFPEAEKLPRVDAKVTGYRMGQEVLDTWKKMVEYAENLIDLTDFMAEEQDCDKPLPENFLNGLSEHRKDLLASLYFYQQQQQQQR